MTLRGSIPEFPLDTIIRFLAGAGKTGRLDLRGSAAGSIGFGSGRIVAATLGEDDGEAALGALLAASSGEFEFIPLDVAPTSNLSGEIEDVIGRAREEAHRLAAIREVVPDDRLVFALSERAAANARIELNPDQWRTLLAINGSRDVAAVAEVMRVSRRVARALLAELVRAGTVDAAAAGTRSTEPAAALAAALPTMIPGEVWVTPPPVAAVPDAWSAPPKKTGWIDSTDPAPAPAPAVPPAAPVESWSVPAPAVEPARPIEETFAGVIEPEPPTPSIDDRLSALRGSMYTPEAPVAPTRESAPFVNELAPPPPAPVVAEPEVERKRGFFGFGAKKNEPAPSSGGSAGAGLGRIGQLAALANALIDEYNSGRYGKGRVEERITNLLLRVDEQAEPLDRPMPVEGQRLAVLALDQGVLPDAQAVPYLVLLVNEIHTNAERAFGRDKAKQGYRAGREQVLGGTDALEAPDLVGKLPKV